ncbi:hypothetical protein O3P69_002294 [Scylla paramamosain]|uniref:Uncharacterized protein n=1 Tax=Scylla paramamosain TaxID=85552 RepID=A0AAW0V5N5_SCYPA
MNHMEATNIPYRTKLKMLLKDGDNLSDLPENNRGRTFTSRDGERLEESIEAIWGREFTYEEGEACSMGG